MMKNRRSYKRISRVAMAGLLTGLGVYAHAGDLSLLSNQVTITGAGASAGFSQIAIIEPNGMVENVVDVPVVDDFGIPNFSFTLLKTEDLTDGEYNLGVAVTFQDNNSDRRLEAMIPNLILTVTDGGNTINGSIPGGQDMRLLGRDDSGTAVVLADITNTADNGPVTVADGTVSINSARLMQAIRGKHPAFTTILNRFTAGAHYTYRIVVQQHDSAQPEILGFGTGHPATTLFPKVRTSCTLSPTSESDAVFILNPATEGAAGELAQHFTEAYAVQGQFNVVGSTGTFTSLAPFTDTCETSGGGGGGGGGDPEPEDVPEPELEPTPEDFVPIPEEPPVDVEAGFNDLEDALGIFDGFDPGSEVPLTEEQFDVINEIFDNLGDLTGGAAEQLANGDLSLEDGLNLLISANSALQLGSSDLEGGGTGDVNVDLGGFITSNQGMADLLSVLSDTDPDSLTDIQKSQFEDIAVTGLTSLLNVLDITNTEPGTGPTGPTLDDDDADALLDSVSNFIGSLLKLSDGDLSTENQAILQQISEQSTDREAKQQFEDLGLADDISDEDAQDVLQNNPDVFDQVLTSAPEIPAPDNSEEQQQQIELQIVQVSIGLSVLEVGQALQIVQSSGVNINNFKSRDGFNPGQSLLSAFNFISNNLAVKEGLQSFNATAPTVNIDPTTGAVRISNDTGTYAASVVSVKAVTALFPEGVSVMPDGRVVAVANGLAIELSGTSANLLGFAAAVTKATTGVNFNSSGSFTLSLSGGEKFSGVFGYDNLAGPTGACGAVTFLPPAGPLNAPGYSFVAQCANGVTQRILPFINVTTFFDVINKAKLKIATDRNTGVMNIATVGNFKPGFFVTPLRNADLTYLNANKNAEGFAFRAKDLNGDGRMDYEVLSTGGIQALFATP